MKISQAFKFEAAHFLPGVPATHRCSRLHGHSYRVEVQLEGPVDFHTGFVVDFFDLTVWPVFNVADSAICVGVAILAWNLLFQPQDAERSADA